MVLTSSARSFSGHHAVGIPDDSARTFDSAHAAADTLSRIYGSFVIDHMYGIRRAVSLTQPAGYARIDAGFSSRLSGIAVAAFDLYVVIRQYDLYKVLRAGVGTESAAYAFVPVYHRRTPVLKLYGRKMTRGDTQAASYAAVCTADAAAPAAYICFFLYPLCHGPSFLQPVAGICKDSFKHSATDGERLFGNRQMIRGSSPRIDISGFQAFGYGSSVLK